MPETNKHVPKVDHEMWLAEKVYGVNVMAFFEGVTQLDQRRQRMRETITLLDLQDKPAGKKDTIKTAYQRLYKEPL